MSSMSPTVNNLSRRFIEPALDYITRVKAPTSSYFEREILARGAYLVLSPVSMIVSAIDTLIGLGAGVLAVLTCGQVPYFVHSAFAYGDSSCFLMNMPFGMLLSVINPQVDLDIDAGARFFVYCTSLLITPLIKQARVWSRSENFIARHLFSRLTYPLVVIATLITRLVQAIMALPLAIFSILTGGCVPWLNYLAFSCLAAPVVMLDLLSSTLECIDPWVQLAPEGEPSSQ